LDSEEAIEHGKDGPNTNKEKGLIECRFFLEKRRPPVVYRDYHHHHHHYPKPWWPSPYWNGPYTTWCDTISRDVPDTSITLGETGGSISGSSYTNSLNDAPLSLNFASDQMKAAIPRGRRGERSRSILRSCNLDNVPTDDGCTVEGRTTGQSFHNVYVDLETEYTTVKLFLQGYDPWEDAERQFQADLRAERKAAREEALPELAKLEAENEQLRLKLAEIENEKLKAKIKSKRSKGQKV